jgi:hypothetical protein
MPIKSKNKQRKANGQRPLAAARGSAATSNNTNLWRRYRLTHVTVAWQERYAGHWYDYSKQITHEEFLKHYSQQPPNESSSATGGATTNERKNV